MNDERPNRALALGALANAAAFLATLAVSFVLAPIVLHALGDDRYGAWSFAESFVAYLTLLDLGIAAALVRFVPRCLAKADGPALNRIYSASLIVFLGGAVASLVIGAAFDYWALEWFLKSPEFRVLFRILVLNFALTLPLSIYPAVLDGVGRFAVKSTVKAAVLVLRVPLTFAAIRMEERLLALGCVITFCNLLEHAILLVIVRRVVPTMRFRPRLVDRATFREIAGYSGQAFAAMMAGRLAFHTDAFVLGPILGPAAITIFSFPARLVEMGKAVLRQGTTTLTSRFSLLEAKDDLAAIRELFLIGTRVAWYCAVPIQVGLYVLGRPFLALWLGESYSVVCTPVLYILAVTLPLTIAQSVGARVLYGTGQLRGFAFATLAEGVTNLVLSLCLIVPYGVPGVALGTAIPHACFCAWVIVTVSRRVGVTGREYADVAMRAIIAGVIPGLIWWWLAGRGINSLIQMAGVGVAGVTVYAIAVWIIETQITPIIADKTIRARLFGLR